MEEEHFCIAAGDNMVRGTREESECYVHTFSRHLKH